MSVPDLAEELESRNKRYGVSWLQQIFWNATEPLIEQEKSEHRGFRWGQMGWCFRYHWDGFWNNIQGIFKYINWDQCCITETGLEYYHKYLNFCWFFSKVIPSYSFNIRIVQNWFFIWPVDIFLVSKSLLWKNHFNKYYNSNALKTIKSYSPRL